MGCGAAREETERTKCPTLANGRGWATRGMCKIPKTGNPKARQDSSDARENLSPEDIQQDTELQPG